MCSAISKELVVIVVHSLYASSRALINVRNMNEKCIQGVFHKVQVPPDFVDFFFTCCTDSINMWLFPVWTKRKYLMENGFLVHMPQLCR